MKALKTRMTNRNALKIDQNAKIQSNAVFFERVADVLDMPKGSKVLEVGCGGGELLALMSQKGFDCYGVEPYPLYSPAFDEGRIKRSTSEDLPFEADEFDLVIVKDVLEHVGNVDESISEILRVSKKYIYLMSPNYLFPYEAHFKVPFLPMMPKFLARIYLRMLGFSRDETMFINHINYVTKISVSRIFNKFERTNMIIDLQLAKKKEYIGPLKSLIDVFCNYKFELLIIKK